MYTTYSIVMKVHHCDSVFTYIVHVCAGGKFNRIFAIGTTVATACTVHVHVCMFTVQCTCSTRIVLECGVHHMTCLSYKVNCSPIMKVPNPPLCPVVSGAIEEQGRAPLVWTAGSTGNMCTH